MTTTITERPILFSGPMVRSILDGRKSVTRRVVKPQPAFRPETVAEITNGGRIRLEDAVREAWEAGECPRCPHGAPGDRLWVRETWRAWALVGAGDFWRVEYRDESHRDLYPPEDWEPPKAFDPPAKWAPSIHMPRWASRTSLEVTDVRVERVQEITRADCLREGIEPHPPYGSPTSYRMQFRDLWDSLNAKRGHSWETNPWVWVVSFRRVEP